MTPADVRSNRERLGMTQTQFANTLGIARSTVARWESADAFIPGWLPIAIKALHTSSLASARVAIVSGDKAYVYIRSEPRLWTVGFYHPDGRWEPESDWVDTEDAAARVAYLNGTVDAHEYDRGNTHANRAGQPLGS